MAALTAKVDNINNNANNINNPNLGGGPISVIRIRKNNHTIVSSKKKTILLLCIENKNIPVNLIWNIMNVDNITS